MEDGVVPRTSVVKFEVLGSSREEIQVLFEKSDCRVALGAEESPLLSSGVTVIDVQFRDGVADCAFSVLLVEQVVVFRERDSISLAQFAVGVTFSAFVVESVSTRLVCVEMVR